VLLFLGLATRDAAWHDCRDSGVVYPNAWTEHLVWSSILVYLLIKGPGIFSIDHLIGRYLTEENSHSSTLQ
jgi:putative oxidoreductase